MTNSRLTSLFVCLGIMIGLPKALFGLHPPTSSQIAKYKADGVWPQRIAKAKRFGNHKMAPHLIRKVRRNLQIQRLKAQGNSDADISRSIVSTPPPSWQGGLPSIGNPKVFVLLVEFPDAPHAAIHTREDIENKFFSNGNASDYPYESLRNYYQRASYDQLTIQGTVFAWYTAANNRSYYEALNYPEGNETLMMEAINYFDGQGHDFSQYDNDNDGVIDALFLKWTGAIGEWASFWWAYQGTWWANPGYRVDGKSFRKFVWSWTAGSSTRPFSVHVDIHETGHLLGLPDYYDYDPDTGPDGGVGDLDMMDGNWGDHNCFSKFTLDWLTPTTIISGTQTITLNPSGTSQDCVLIMPDVTEGNAFDEYFMAQYRKRSEGNDPSDYPTDGLILWHVDATLDALGDDYLYDNSYSSHKLLRLMEADGLEQIEQELRVNAGDFYRPPSEFGPDTFPNSRNYVGEDTKVAVDQLGIPGSTMEARFLIIVDAFPPVAEDVTATVAMEIAKTITLRATDDGLPDPPGALSYIITSLPTHGSLSDPNGGTINNRNYRLLNYGNEVNYAPSAGYVGQDSFQYKANDGGTAPSGGDSNIATVSIRVVGPNIELNPTSLSPQVPEGQNAANDTFTVSNNGAGQFNYNISVDESWLSVAPSSGGPLSLNDEETITVSYTTDTLAWGTYPATITVESPEAENSPQTIDVTLTVLGPELSVSPTVIPVETGLGLNAPPQTFEVSNAGYGSLDFTITEAVSWLSVSPDSGTLAAADAPATITVDFDTVNLAVGTYTGTITVDSDAPNSPITVTISLTVRGPTISLDPWILEPTVGFGQNADAQTFHIANSAAGLLDFAITPSASWLSVRPTTGTIGVGVLEPITVNYATSGLDPGEYATTIVLTGNADNSPQNVTVNLSVLPPIIGVAPLQINLIDRGTSPADQVLTVRNVGAGILENYAIATVSPWIRSVTPTIGSSTGPGDLIAHQVTFDTTSMANGVYVGKIVISATYSDPPEITVPVVLRIARAAPLPDAELDGFADDIDNCPNLSNPDQADTDSDGIGDACDNCPNQTNVEQNDADSDGIGDACDNCLNQPNPNQADADSDGFGDACDLCRRVVDNAQLDADSDGVGDACDNCLNEANPNQLDGDGDHVGTACDNCPIMTNANQLDSDSDGIGDRCDNCPTMINPNQFDADADGAGDVCDNCPAVVNGDQSDSDSDGIGDVCDNCPTAANPGQADTDADGVGNACESAAGQPSDTGGSGDGGSGDGGSGTGGSGDGGSGDGGSGTGGSGDGGSGDGGSGDGTQAGQPLPPCVLGMLETAMISFGLLALRFAPRRKQR